MKPQSVKPLLFAVGIFLFMACSTKLTGQTVDSLLNKMVQKGLVTQEEADELRKESEPGFEKAYRVKTGLPDWVKSLKLTADFRARYDWIHQDPDNYGPTDADFSTFVSGVSSNGYAVVDRHRFRYRLRFGAVANLADHYELGLRLGSGEVNSSLPSIGDGIFSANSTLNNDANRKYIFVDLAYGKWMPCNWAQFEVGKMNNAFWFTDMVMDPDYNPEGAQEKLILPLGQKHKVTLTSGQFVILENFAATGGTNLNNDVYLFINQVDWTAAWTPHLSTRLGAAMINFNGQENITSRLEDFINQNGTRLDGTNQGSFNPQFLRNGLPPFVNPIIGRGELTYTLVNFPGFRGPFPITLGIEYAQNTAADPNINEAYNLGISFGHARSKGNWMITYNYKNIERSSVWHGLNDDDFGFNGRGGTDVRGHQVIASWRVADPLTFTVRYMKTEQIAAFPGTHADQDRLFMDLVWAF
jgi:hypothetical protein